MPPNSVTVRYGSKGAKQTVTEVAQLHNELTKLQKVTAKGFITGVGAGVGLGAIHAVGGAVHDVTQIVDEATNAYIDNEHSIQRLDTAIRANVANWNGDTKAIDARLEAGVKLGFSNAEIRDSMAGLVGATHDVNDALHVQNVAMDLARFKGISLQDASEALTKVEAGSYRILKSLGIELKAGATQTEALAAVEKVASGQAADFAGTLEGKLAVAAAKTTESLSRLGKETAGFKADFESAKADAIDNFATGLDFVADRANYASQSLERQVEILLVQRNELRQGSDAWNTMTAAIDALQKRIDAQKMADLANFPGKLRDDLPGATEAFRHADAAAKSFDGTVNTLSFDARNLAGSIQTAASALENDLFGTAIEAGRKADLQSQLKDLNKQLKGTTGDKRTGLLGQIASVKQALFDLNLQEAQKAGPDALIAFLDSEKAHTKDLTKAERDLITAMEDVARKQKILDQILIGDPLTGHYYTGANPLGTHRAPGTAAPGTVTQHSAPTKPGRVDVYVHVDGHLSSAQVYTLVQRLGPYLAKYLQSHNLVPHQAIL